MYFKPGTHSELATHLRVCSALRLPHLGQNLKLALLWAALAVALPPVVLLPAALLEVLLPLT